MTSNVCVSCRPFNPSSTRRNARIVNDICLVSEDQIHHNIHTVNGLTHINIGDLAGSGLPWNRNPDLWRRISRDIAVIQYPDVRGGRERRPTASQICGIPGSEMMEMRDRTILRRWWRDTVVDMRVKLTDVWRERRTCLAESSALFPEVVVIVYNILHIQWVKGSTRSKALVSNCSAISVNPKAVAARCFCVKLLNYSLSAVSRQNTSNVTPGIFHSSILVY